MENKAKQDIISLVAAYSAVTGDSRATIGKKALNDNSFFRRVIDGDASCTLRTADRLVKWFADNWPEAVAWPEGVTRPK